MTSMLLINESAASVRDTAEPVVYGRIFVTDLQGTAAGTRHGPVVTCPWPPRRAVFARSESLT